MWGVVAVLCIRIQIMIDACTVGGSSKTMNASDIRMTIILVKHYCEGRGASGCTAGTYGDSRSGEKGKCSKQQPSVATTADTLASFLLETLTCTFCQNQTSQTLNKMIL